MFYKSLKKNTPGAQKAARAMFYTAHNRSFSQGRRIHAEGPGEVVTKHTHSQIGAVCATALSKYVFHPACITCQIGLMPKRMAKLSRGTISVIFVAQRTDADVEGYAVAAQRMDALAARQEGFIGMNSVRGPDGLGITVSYWTDEESAKAWRDHPEHAAIRDAGRDRWYSHYSLHVTQVTRSYDWEKA